MDAHLAVEPPVRNIFAPNIHHLPTFALEWAVGDGHAQLVAESDVAAKVGFQAKVIVCTRGTKQ